MFTIHRWNVRDGRPHDELARTQYDDVAKWIAMACAENLTVRDQLHRQAIVGSAMVVLIDNDSDTQRFFGVTENTRYEIGEIEPD